MRLTAARYLVTAFSFALTCAAITQDDIGNAFEEIGKISQRTVNDVTEENALNVTEALRQITTIYDKDITIPLGTDDILPEINKPEVCSSITNSLERQIEFSHSLGEWWKGSHIPEVAQRNDEFAALVEAVQNWLAGFFDAQLKLDGRLASCPEAEKALENAGQAFITDLFE